MYRMFVHLFCSLLYVQSAYHLGVRATTEEPALRFEIQPKNGIVELNSNVTLLCYNNGTDGTFYIYKSNNTHRQDTLVAYNKNEHPMFAIGDVLKSESHQHTLVYPSIEQPTFGITFNSGWTDEGEYWCERTKMLDKIKSNSKNITISLPSGQPILYVSNGATEYKSGDVISINCTGDVGRPAGSLHLNSTVVGSMKTEEEKVWTTNNHTSFQSVQTQVQLTKEYQNQSFCCSVTNSLRRKSNTSNTVCSSPLTIYLVVEEVTLEPLKNSYFIDEVIHCHANGWPEPSYTWIKSSTSNENADLIIDGADLIINMSNTTIWPDGVDSMDFEYTCKASNIVLNNKYVISKTHYFHVKRERLVTKPIDVVTEKPVRRVTHGSAKISWLKLHEQALKIGAIVTSGVCLILIIIFGAMHCALKSKKEINYHKLESERGR